ncbi:MAG: tetratricopeptide repeat protein, partial [Anaerolineales bacterium]|nr:tetratricopeptide repeat protein [Anaerolineales bacterium]
MENQHRSLVMRLSLFLVLAILLAPAAHSHQVSQQMQQAQAALALGLPSQAARRLAEAARYSPWRSDLWELAGRYALQAGDHQLALDYLQQAERGGQLSAQGWIDLGDAYQASGDLPSAEQAWEASLAAGGDPDQLARRLARADLARGNYTSAIARLQALAAAQPGDAEVYYQSGLLIITKDPEAALEYLNRAAELDSSLEAPVSKLRRSVISARFAEDPAYTLLAGGRALASLGRWDLATQTFRAA